MCHNIWYKKTRMKSLSCGEKFDERAQVWQRDKETKQPLPWLATVTLLG